MAVVHCHSDVYNCMVKHYVPFATHYDTT